MHKWCINQENAADAAMILCRQELAKDTKDSIALGRARAVSGGK
jgi:hypothetical protein